MNAISKVASVGVGAVLAVGLMGMTAASGDPDHSASATSGQHQHGVLGATDEGIVEKAKGDLPRLRGKVDGDRNLTISDDPVPSGRYRLIVRDTTSRHNWHIFGNGVDRETSINGTGRSAWTVRLSDGNYTVQCDAHSGTMRFTLNVT